MPPIDTRAYRPLQDALMEQAAKLGSVMRKVWHGQDTIPEAKQRIPKPYGPPMRVQVGPRAIERR